MTSMKQWKTYIPSLCMLLNPALLSGKEVEAKSVSWWNNDCQYAQSERNRAERALNRNNTLYNKISYKRIKALCRKVFKSVQKQTWIQYILTRITVQTFFLNTPKKMTGKYVSQPNGRPRYSF